MKPDKKSMHARLGDAAAVGRKQSGRHAAAHVAAGDDAAGGASKTVGALDAVTDELDDGPVEELRPRSMLQK